VTVGPCSCLLSGSTLSSRQYIVNPGYNRYRGRVVVPSLRARTRSSSGVQQNVMRDHLDKGEFNGKLTQTG
jgi:hypothetical protein